MNRIEKNMAWTIAMAGVLLSAAPGEARAQQPGDLARGAQVYGVTCGRCHNPRSPVERSDREWTVIVNHMRTRAGLPGRASRDVLAFLQATNGDAPRGIGASEVAAEPVRQPATVVISTAPATVAEGRALMSSTGCIGCHVIDGLGGQIGPTLNGVVENKGALFVYQKVFDPSFDDAGTLMPNLGLSDEQITAVIAYLATLR